MKILLISPQTPETFWSFKNILHFIFKKAAFPPLGLLTVAAMLPQNWDLKVIDMNVHRIDDQDLLWADYVMISAMLVHRNSVLGIVKRCQHFSRPLIAGGPLFTTDQTSIAGVNHIVIGEAEGIIDELIKDMRWRKVKKIYRAGPLPDISLTPIPRWDLIDLTHYATMALQASRGCPFDCEFCDIVAINGHTPRIKSVPQFIRELESLRMRGVEGSVFIVDDNFIGNKIQIKEILKSIIEWQKKTKARMTFFTEASMNLADDEELCGLMAKANFKKVFFRNRNSFCRSTCRMPQVSKPKEHD